MSAVLPKSKFNDKIETDLCFFVKKDIPLYKKLMASSNFPEQCPIEPGKYVVQKLHIDLTKVPLLAKGFTANATFTIYNADKILAVINVWGFVE